MFKILCNYPDMTDATSWYRGAGVMQNLYKKMPDVHCEVSTVVHWTLLKGHDALFLQRPFLDSHIKCIEMAKSLNVPVWVDIDDLLTNVPRGTLFLSQILKQFEMSPLKLKNNVIKILELADVVTVSTEFLKQEYSQYSDKITVINNAVDDYFFPDRSAGTRKDIVIWRGSQSHKNDLAEYEEQIANLIDKHKDHTFVFMGYNSKIFTKLFSNTVFIEPTGPYEYFMAIKKMRPKVFMVPLEDHAFNRAKSNIAALEANTVGAACVAPDMPEWGGVSLTSQSKTHWEESVSCLISSSEDLSGAVSLAAKHIDENYMLSNIQNKRVEIVKELKKARK